MSVAAPLMYRGGGCVQALHSVRRYYYPCQAVTLVYLYRENRWDTHEKLSIVKFDFVQVSGLSLNFYNNTLRKFYKFSDSWQTWTSLTLQLVFWPISRQYYRPQMRKRVSYPCPCTLFIWFTHDQGYKALPQRMLCCPPRPGPRSSKSRTVFFFFFLINK